MHLDSIRSQSASREWSRRSYGRSRSREYGRHRGERHDGRDSSRYKSKRDERKSHSRERRSRRENRKDVSVDWSKIPAKESMDYSKMIKGYSTMTTAEQLKAKAR